MHAVAEVGNTFFEKRRVCREYVSRKHTENIRRRCSEIMLALLNCAEEIVSGELLLSDVKAPNGTAGSFSTPLSPTFHLAGDLFEIEDASSCAN